MNEETQVQLMEYVKQAVEFGTEQAPMVAQEVLEYGMWSSCATIAILMASGLVLAAFSFACYRFDLGWTDSSFGSEPTNDGPMAIACGIIGAVFIFVAPIFICECSMDIVKIQTAPRLYIIQELSK